MVAFVLSVVVSLLALLPIVLVGMYRPKGKPVTWGEALLAATYVFFLFWWAYGVVPHLFLSWADNELGWRPDNIVYGPGNILRPQAFDGWLPLTISYQTLRDLVVVLIYGVYLAIPIAGWWLWQTRGERKPEAVETTAYGRPLIKKGV